MKKMLAVLGGVSAVMVASTAMAEPHDGIKVGQHMTLRPYVSLSYTYDSNPDSSRHSRSATPWVVNPGVSMEYKHDNWDISGNVWYRYHAYNRYRDQLNESSYGERLSIDWANSLPNERGWKLMISENYSQVSQDDDMTDQNGRGLWRDRKEAQVTGVLERRINEYWHLAADGNYYWMDYDNDVMQYAPLYGWTRWGAGGEFGFAPSKWTDFILSANYQWYESDNHNNLLYNVRDISRESRGFSVMGGVATRATEKISYRFLTGWSRFEYADGLATSDGWTYQAAVDWKMSETWRLALLAASYFQPSERDYGSAIRVDSVSWGLGHTMVKGKLSATADLAYRREDHVYTAAGNAGDYTDDILSGRFGLTYKLNSYLQVYGSIEYQLNNCSGGAARNNHYDYDRYRANLGLRLIY